MLPNSQASTDAHSPFKDTLFQVLFDELDSSIGRFHTFPNFGNYHEFSFPLNGGTMPPSRHKSLGKFFITFPFSFSSN
jgi:hypothetical protein